MRIGNLKMRNFFELVTQIWSQVILVHETHKLVNVFRDRIEGIN